MYGYNPVKLFQNHLVWSGVSIPKEILARRPDISEARLQAIAQSESIGAIKANLYPAFSLVGTFVLTSNNIGASSINDILNWSSRLYYRRACF